MSFTDGWMALHLDMPDRVPRTEYSADSHWPLVERVIGRGHDGSREGMESASAAFRGAWNYDFVWSILTNEDVFGQHRTDMGHADYAGEDYRAQARSPFPDGESVLAFDPDGFYRHPNAGELTAAYDRQYAHNCRANPDAVNMTGIYTTCMSGLIAMFGWGNLLEALSIDKARFGEVVNSYGRLISRYFEALAQCSAPVVMVHDDLVWTSGPFVHPNWYRRYIFPNIRRCLEPLLASGKRIAFTCDGDFTPLIDDIAACGVHGFVLEPHTDMAAIAERYGRTHFFIGNADTRALLGGSRDRIEAEVRRCMAIGKDCPGFFMAVGNHIPANTPVESALWYNDCYEKLSRR